MIPGARASVPAAILFGVLFFLAACGDNAEPSSENYGNLLASPGGLIVLEEEHPTGWMRPDCFSCHNVLNMHTVNRTGLPNCNKLPQPPMTSHAVPKNSAANLRSMDSLPHRTLERPVPEATLEEDDPVASRSG